MGSTKFSWKAYSRAKVSVLAGKSASVAVAAAASSGPAAPGLDRPVAVADGDETPVPGEREGRRPGVRPRNAGRVAVGLRRHRLTASLVLFVALVARLSFVVDHPRGALVYDELLYDGLAANVLIGRGFSLDGVEVGVPAAYRDGPTAIMAPGYPALLAHVDAPPPAVYVKGREGLLSRPAIAIVGSRQASAAGLTLARRFAALLGQRGLVTVSGLARGIDAAGPDRHRGLGRVALEAPLLVHHALGVAVGDPGSGLPVPLGVIAGLTVMTLVVVWPFAGLLVAALDRALAELT